MMKCKMGFVVVDSIVCHCGDTITVTETCLKHKKKYPATHPEGVRIPICKDCTFYCVNCGTISFYDAIFSQPKVVVSEENTSKFLRVVERNELINKYKTITEDVLLNALAFDLGFQMAADEFKQKARKVGMSTDNLSKLSGIVDKLSSINFLNLFIMGTGLTGYEDLIKPVFINQLFGGGKDVSKNR